MRIDTKDLPPYEQIANTAISEAVAAFDAAKSDADQAKKDHQALVDELPQAHEQDVATAALARSEGKAGPKTRAATAKAEKEIADAQFNVDVTKRLVDEARAHLRDVLAEQGGEWAASVIALVEGLDQEWDARVSDLIALHGQRAAQRKLARKLGADLPAVHAISLDAHRELQGIELARNPGMDALGNKIDANAVAGVYVEDVLSALADLGKPVEAEPELTPEQREAKQQETAAFGRRWLQRDDPGPENERQQQDEFLARAKQQKAADRSATTTITEG